MGSEIKRPTASEIESAVTFLKRNTNDDVYAAVLVLERALKSLPLPEGWRAIETAPKDGTHFIGLGPVPGDGDVEARETHWYFYGKGSLAKAAFDRGEGPSGAWRWSEPIHNWETSWGPTHWMPLPTPPEGT
jgi:hypothetical protein